MHTPACSPCVEFKLEEMLEQGMGVVCQATLLWAARSLVHNEHACLEVCRLPAALVWSLQASQLTRCWEHLW
jgi:hypothetical protein